MNSVTGEANFSMESTCLTVGGFSQPTVARSLIEQSVSAEIGLTQRFLWTFPRPTYSRYHMLEEVDKDFTEKIGKVHKCMLVCFSVVHRHIFVCKY